MTINEGPGLYPENWFLSRISQESVSKRFKPVILFRNDKPCGVGSVFKDGSGREIIVTAGHLFEKVSGVMTWTFRRMRPFTDYREPILRASLLPGCPHLDVALAFPGETSPPPIVGFCDSSIGEVVSEEYTVDPLGVSHKIYSLITNKECACVGVSVSKRTGAQYFIASIETYCGESGTGFVDLSNNDTIYVLKGHCEKVPPVLKEALHLSGDAFSVFARLRIP